MSRNSATRQRSAVARRAALLTARLDSTAVPAQLSPPVLQRRQLLRLVGGVLSSALASLLLGACSRADTAGPTAAPTAAPTTASARVDIFNDPAPAADVREHYGPEPLHFGELRLPAGPGPHPLLMMIHGGFWRARYDLHHTGHLCAALRAIGVASWNVEYRRLGDPGGGWPNTLLDVARAADYLRELGPRHNLDLDRVVVMGHSAGGHLALWLAGRSRLPPGSPLASPDEPLPLRAVLGLAAVSDLRRAWELGLSQRVVQDLLGGTPDQLGERYTAASPIELLPLGVRQVLIHGTDDDIVPFELSQRYHELARQRGDDVELLALPAAGHFEVIEPGTPEWSQVQQVVLKLLN